MLCRTDEIASALGDGPRWRIVELLAERPRSVGELAELTGLRQPQTTKHLQTLARAGLVTVTPLGQRRVYAIKATPLRAFAHRLRELVDTVEAQADERDVLARYRAAIDAESAVADQDRWADGRTFSFERVLAAPPDVVWRHWVDPDRLATWWAPPSMTVTGCVLEPKPGGRAVLDYRDAEGRYRSLLPRSELTDTSAGRRWCTSVPGPVPSGRAASRSPPTWSPCRPTPMSACHLSAGLASSPATSIEGDRSEPRVSVAVCRGRISTQLGGLEG